MNTIQKLIEDMKKQAEDLPESIATDNVISSIYNLEDEAYNFFSLFNVAMDEIDELRDRFYE